MNNKPTIFGEESFIVSNMAEQFYHKEIEFRDDVFIGRIACDFNLDKEKVKRQLELCNKLESIDKTDLIDIATNKKFADKDYEIKVLQKALELACKDVHDLTQNQIGYELCYECEHFDLCNKLSNTNKLDLECEQVFAQAYKTKAKESERDELQD